MFFPRVAISSPLLTKYWIPFASIYLNTYLIIQHTFSDGKVKTLTNKNIFTTRWKKLLLYLFIFKYLSNYTTPLHRRKRGKTLANILTTCCKQFLFRSLQDIGFVKKMCRPRVAIFLIRSNQSGKCVSCQAQLCGPPFIFYKSSPRFFPNDGDIEN